jgi:3-oxoacyl-[acyl-carrier protein] reductase
MSLNQKIAWVTGASRGIGASIADTLGKQGAVVVGTATSEAGANAITERFKAAGIEGQGLVLDVSDLASVEAAYAQIKTDLGGLPSILVNNAGITQDNLLLRMTPEQWNAVIQTNLTGVYYLSKCCLRAMMKARWGRIINISSVVGAMGNAGQMNYAAAKAGVIGMSKSLAQEIASRGITVNVVAPGFIGTDMTQGDGGLTEEQQAALLASIPLGKMGKPEDIAMAVAFLASDSASYITGETLHVNGGMYMS